ncbi:short chain dehydrogenase family protein [Mycobacterium kansasii 824]|nr:short chain dehydrogenase family protein [Mycobacterium kansasii 824]
MGRLLSKSKATTHGALAVVTGAGSGIGAAFAVELGRRGGAVVCSDVDEIAAHKTAAMLTERGAKAIAIRCDVSRVDDVCSLAEQSQSWFDAAPTLVINNAGVGPAARPSVKYPWMIGSGYWASISGAHPRLPRIHSDPAHGRAVTNAAGHHQCRLGSSVRRSPGHGCI